MPFYRYGQGASSTDFTKELGPLAKAIYGDPKAEIDAAYRRSAIDKMGIESQAKQQEIEQNAYKQNAYDRAASEFAQMTPGDPEAWQRFNSWLIRGQAEDKHIQGYSRGNAGVLALDPNVPRDKAAGFSALTGIAPYENTPYGAELNNLANLGPGHSTVNSPMMQRELGVPPMTTAPGAKASSGATGLFPNVVMPYSGGTYAEEQLNILHAGEWLVSQGGRLDPAQLQAVANAWQAKTAATSSTMMGPWGPTTYRIDKDPLTSYPQLLRLFGQVPSGIAAPPSGVTPAPVQPPLQQQPPAMQQQTPGVTTQPFSPAPLPAGDALPPPSLPTPTPPQPQAPGPELARQDIDLSHLFGPSQAAARAPLPLGEVDNPIRAYEQMQFPEGIAQYFAEPVGQQLPPLLPLNDYIARVTEQPNRLVNERPVKPMDDFSNVSGGVSSQVPAPRQAPPTSTYNVPGGFEEKYGNAQTAPPAAPVARLAPAPATGTGPPQASGPRPKHWVEPLPPQTSPEADKGFVDLGNGARKRLLEANPPKSMTTEEATRHQLLQGAIFAHNQMLVNKKPPNFLEKEMARTGHDDTYVGRFRQYLASDRGKQWEHEGRLFLEPALRLRTGAAAPVHEYAPYYAMFIEMPGDSPQLQESKKLAREVLLKSLQQTMRGGFTIVILQDFILQLS